MYVTYTHYITKKRTKVVRWRDQKEETNIPGNQLDQNLYYYDWIKMIPFSFFHISLLSFLPHLLPPPPPSTARAQMK
jgi:hypothetical protein